jgi:hypothetical protein
MPTKTEEAVKSLLLRELGKLTTREKTHLKSFVDKAFVAEELQRVKTRKIVLRWTRVALWILFVVLMFSFVRFSVPSNPTYLAMAAIVIYTVDAALVMQFEALRRRELIYRALRRFALPEGETESVRIDELDDAD